MRKKENERNLTHPINMDLGHGFEPDDVDAQFYVGHQNLKSCNSFCWWRNFFRFINIKLYFILISKLIIFIEKNQINNI